MKTRSILHLIRATFICGMALILAGCQQRAVAENDIFTVVRSNNADRLTQYLAEGGDPDLVDSQGDSLLYLATGAKGGIEVTRVLVTGGAQIDLANADGRTPLHNAAGWCNVDIVAVLVAGGADLDAVDGSGKSVEETVCARPADRRAETLILIGK